MAFKSKSNTYAPVTRTRKGGRPQPVDKRTKESWKRRNTARLPLQEAYAAALTTTEGGAL